MSWKERATPVSTSTGGGWRERAKPVEQPGGTGSFIDNAAAGAADKFKAVLETVAAPFELAGEAARMAIESNNPGDFRAPSIVQRFTDPNDQTPAPADPVSLANKLIRGGAGAVNAAVTGQPIMQGAREAYNADRGTMGVVEDIAGGLLTGKVAPQTFAAPLDAAAEAARLGVKAAGKAGKTIVGRGFMGVPEAAQERRFLRNAEVRNAPSFDELSNKVANSTTKLKKEVVTSVKKLPDFNEVSSNVAGQLNRLSDEADTLTNDAWDRLLKLKAQPVSKMVRILNDAKKDITGEMGIAVGRSDESAIKSIDGMIANLKSFRQKGMDGKKVNPKLEQFLTQRQQKELIDKIRANVDWSNPEKSKANEAFLKIQAKINEHLRNDNEGWAKIMDPLAERVSLLDEAAAKLSIAKKGGKFSPSDLTPGKLRAALSSEKTETRSVLERLNNLTDHDVLHDLKKAAFKEEVLTKGVPSRELRSVDPVTARKARAADLAKKKLGLDVDDAGAFVPGDNTPNRLHAIGDNKRALSRSVVGRLERETGSKFLPTIDDAAAKHQFSVARPQGSARTAVGGLLGLLVDGATGTHGGATFGGGAAGFLLDKFGGRVTGKGIDAAARGSNGLARLAELIRAKTYGTAIEPAARNALAGQPIFGPLINANPNDPYLNIARLQRR